MTRGEKALTGAAFAVGNVLATFPAVGSRQKAESRDDPEVELNTTSSVTSALAEPCGLRQVTWETTLYQPVFRKLVNESSRVFLALQKSMSNEEAESKSFDVVSGHSLQKNVFLRNFNCPTIEIFQAIPIHTTRLPGNSRPMERKSSN